MAEAEGVDAATERGPADQQDFDGLGVARVTEGLVDLRGGLPLEDVRSEGDRAVGDEDTDRGRDDAGEGRTDRGRPRGRLDMFGIEDAPVDDGVRRLEDAMGVEFGRPATATATATEGSGRGVKGVFRAAESARMRRSQASCQSGQAR